jgi:hypothetical protein
VGTRTAAFGLLVGTLVLAAQAAGKPSALPRNYTFSFTVSLKPYYTEGVPATKVTGSGSGSFSIRDRQQDRDNTFFWHVFDAKGSFTLMQGGRVLAAGTVTGGTFGVEGTAKSLLRSALLTVHLSSSRFHCAKPDASLGLEDHRLPTKGDTEGMGFFACKAKMNWNGRPPVVDVKITPA